MPSPGPEIRQITFAPFMFSGPCNPQEVRWRSFVDRLRADTNASHAELTDLEKTLFAPAKPAKLLLESAGSTLSFYLFPVGVGVCEICWPINEASREATPNNILSLRKVRHQELLKGTAGVGARVRTVITLTRRIVRPDIRLPSFVLADSGTCPYVFSLFVLRTTDGDAECQAMVDTLLQPSRLGFSDADWDRQVSAVVNNRDAARAPNKVEWDLRESVHCYMSWASVVATSKGDVDDICALYGTLECRLQSAWCLSHLLGCIQGFHERLTGYQAELIAATLETGIRELAPLRDPTASERVKKLYEGMMETSGLEAKIVEAREHVGMLRAFAVARATRKRERYELVTEILLFLLVCLQLLPLIQKDPLEGAARTWLIVGVGVSVGVYSLIRWWARR